ncbi:hypothetical protein I2F17_02665 [Acinetobacter sp. B10A]|uniref:hypothetical protein n=1 Tax=Acinetobacter baretiae TaxID=2605383 RepID=UPI001B3C55FE|nr:hypothetical protein [Acinetobacter baretiae]MBF7684738.1 hypothetical protein [Acinetobacter baretiae]
MSRYTHALPLYNTDDAQITSNNTCQLEFGQTNSKTQQQLSINPACSLHNYELSVPINYVDRDTYTGLQIKHPFYSSERFGIAVSSGYTPKQHQNDANWQFNIPASLYITPEFQIDANIGWYHQSKNANDMTWAIAATHDLPHAQKIALEYYSPALDPSQIQLIWGLEVIKDQTNIYLAYGQTLKSSVSRWMGLGFSWNFG